ncbi:MAG: hypothetical protein NNA19_03960 [Nitrospira sp.]|nr:hypothetical protein [Nitrospira sp.]MCP9474387.1 hypothetical protein [Nitrospira sp.]
MDSTKKKCTGSPLFDRYIGIDYSGAKTPTDSLKGLRIYAAAPDDDPEEIHPPPSRRRYWTRKGAAQWLLERLREPTRTLVGIDHGFSFPLPYFHQYGLPLDWPAFLEDFHRHWPTDGDHVSVDDVRYGRVGMGQARLGHPRWLRLTEQRARAAKSVFRFDVEGSVAKSTHAGLPWLLMIRRLAGTHVHLWPFDGWKVPGSRSVVAEVYPSLWRRAIPTEGRTPDQQDAYVVADWMRTTDRAGTLSGYFTPTLTPGEQTQASIEGWILGVR